MDESTVSIEELFYICFAIGKMLQGIPQKNRELAIARLLNMADACRKNGDPAFTYIAIEAVVRGWKDWPNTRERGVLRQTGGEINQ